MEKSFSCPFCGASHTEDLEDGTRLTCDCGVFAEVMDEDDLPLFYISAGEKLKVCPTEHLRTERYQDLDRLMEIKSIPLDGSLALFWAKSTVEHPETGCGGCGGHCHH